jgi:diguanylate cyclase (GGDEF)-like protein/PAS domain S-box-containing protein
MTPRHRGRARPSASLPAPPGGRRAYWFLFMAAGGAGLVLGRGVLFSTQVDPISIGGSVAALAGAGAVAHLLASSALREHRARRRADMLARASSTFLAATNQDEAHGAAESALREIASEAPEVRITYVAGRPERAIPVVVLGEEEWQGPATPIDLTSILPADALVALREGSRASFTSGPHYGIRVPSGFSTGHVLAVPIGGREELRGVIVVSAEDELEEWLQEAVEALSAELSLAIDGLARKDQFRSLIQHSSDVITVVDSEGVIRLQSPAVERVFGYKTDDLVGRNLSELLHVEDVDSVMEVMAKPVSGAVGAVPFEARWLHADGSWRHGETVVTNKLDDPNVAGFVLNTRDVTERKNLEEQLAHRSLHDPLTDLANRSLFKDSVERALRRTGRDGRTVSVVFMDVDDFKHVNDSLGHAAGDKLLEAVAGRIRECIRPYDVAARLGGDEFGVLLENADQRVAASVADRVLRSMDEPIRVDGLEISVHASLGIAVGSTGDQVEDIMRNADVAMYIAKGRGKARYEIFQPGMQATALERMEMAAELRRAVEERELLLHYQPIVSLQTGAITGVEALLRWMHPTRGMVPPMEFIPTAEDTGLIVPIGRWALNEACRQLREWQDRHGDPPLSVAVNVSVKQLQDPRFVHDVRAALAATGVDARSLTLEITETVLMADAEEVLARLEELHAVGVRVAIDDFGTGYASLGYLTRFPVNILKIDRSFVQGVGRPEGSHLTPVMVSIGRTLGLQTVAEGVETPEQVVRLRELGFDAAQGFLFSRPAAADEMEHVLAVRRLVRDFTSAEPSIDPVAGIGGAVSS